MWAHSLLLISNTRHYEEDNQLYDWLYTIYLMYIQTQAIELIEQGYIAFTYQCQILKFIYLNSIYYETYLHHIVLYLYLWL